jgi:hypothetical protein
LASGSADGDEDNNKKGPSPHTIENDASSLFWDSKSEFLECATELDCEIDDEPDCDVDICELFPSICEDDDSVDGDYEYTLTNSTSVKRSILEPRGAKRLVKIILSDGTLIQFYSQPYPSIGELYKGVNGEAVIKSAFDFVSSKCELWDVLDRLLDDVNMKDFVTEHIVEVIPVPSML